MRDVLESLLVGEGYRVELNKTGEEGLERVEIRRWIRALVETRVDHMGIETLAERLDTVEKQTAYFERVFQRIIAEIQALFDEALLGSMALRLTITRTGSFSRPA